MPPASVVQMALPLGEAPDKSDEWDRRLVDAFANEGITSGFLPLAEEAVRAMPGDGYVLCLAATAALLDRHPDRALVFLKRYSKRYVPIATYHLLHALALELQNKPTMAGAILERHGLTSLPDVMRVFPAGWARRNWLRERLVNIFGRDAMAGRRAVAPPTGRIAGRAASAGALKAPPKAAIKAGPNTGSKGAPKIAPKTAPKAATQRPIAAPAPPPAAAEIAAAPAELVRIDIDIPFAVEFDLAPLASAASGRPERDGA